MSKLLAILYLTFDFPEPMIYLRTQRLRKVVLIAMYFVLAQHFSTYISSCIALVIKNPKDMFHRMEFISIYFDGWAIASKYYITLLKTWSKHFYKV